METLGGRCAMWVVVINRKLENSALDDTFEIAWNNLFISYAQRVQITMYFMNLWLSTVYLTLDQVSMNDGHS